MEDAEKEAIAIVEAGQAWLNQPLHKQLGDVAKSLGELPAKTLENEMTAGLGTSAGASVEWPA